MRPYLIILSIILTACQSQKDHKQPIKPVDLAQLRMGIDSLFTAHVGEHEPGAAVLVAYEGEMLIGKGYGMRDVEAGEPITSKTNMRMASVSKQFTALTVLRLVDQGKLSLSDSVYTYLPVASFVDGTTIEQLINHTSGKADAEEALMTEWDSTQIAVNQNVLDWYAKSDRTIAPAGETFQYNNGIYELIGCLVEEVGDQPFAAFAEAQVFQPAGMENTQFFSLANPVEIPERAYCYEQDSEGNWSKVDGHFLNGLLGAGGVYTSVEDYFHYDQAMRNKTLLSPALHDRIVMPSSTEETKDGKRQYAMGWFVTDSTASHTGGWFGTNTFTLRYLDKPLTIAVFMNRNTLFRGNLVKETVSLVEGYLQYLSTHQTP